MVGKYVKKLILRLAIFIGVFLLMWLVAPQQKKDITDSKKVELQKEESVGTYDEFNDAGMMGLDERFDTCVHANGSEDIDFISYADWTVRNGSWVDNAGNPYIKVGYRVDTTSKGNQLDATNTGTFVTNIPSEIEIIPETISVSHSYMNVSLSEGNKKLTVNWSKNLGYNRYYVVYVCILVKEKLPQNILNGTEYFNTNGETVVQPLDQYGTKVFSGQGCAKVKTGGHNTYLLSSPAMKYKVNTSSPFRYKAGGEKEYGWTLVNYGNAPYFMKVNHQDYDADGNKHYRVNLVVDTTMSQIQSENMVIETEIPDVYDYVGNMDVNDSAINAVVQGRKIHITIRAQLKRKIYYISFETKLRIADIPVNYYPNQNPIPLYTSGNTYDYTKSVVGMKVTWGNYGTVNVSSGGVALPSEGNITYYLDGGTINSGAITSYRYGQAVALPTNVSKEGMNFGGWLTYESGQGEVVTHIGPKERGSKSYWAIWNPKSYKVTLHTNGGEIEEGLEVTRYMKGVGAELPIKGEITRMEHRFLGWYDNEALEGIAVSRIPATAIGDKEYWAKWEHDPTLGEDGVADYLGNLVYVYGNVDDWQSYYTDPLSYVIDTEPSDEIYTWLSTEPGGSGTRLTNPIKVKYGQRVTVACPPAVAFKVTQQGDDTPLYAVIRYKDEYLVHVEGDPDTSDDDYSYWETRYVYDSIRFTMRFKAAQALG